MQWVGHMQRMGRERLPKAMLWGEMDGGVRRQGRPTKTWLDGVKIDLKELGRLVLHWRKLCQNREKWGKSIKPFERKTTKGEPVAGRATKAELRSQGSSASDRLRERSGQGVPEATKESVDLEEVTIEVVTERHRMTVEERRELRRRHARANMTEVNPHARDDINNDIVVDMLKPERKSPR